MFQKNKIYLDGKRVNELPENYILNLNAENCKIKLNSFSGSGKLRLDVKCNNFTFEFGKENTINNVVNVIVNRPQGAVGDPAGIVHIGKNNIFNGSLIVLSPYQQTVQIGDNNLFARDIFIRGLIEHLVYDINTKEQLNKEEGIYIGNENWICDNVKFLNRSIVADKNIVGENSLVNKTLIVRNCIIAGCPATVKKENVMWNVRLDYKE